MNSLCALLNFSSRAGSIVLQEHCRSHTALRVGRVREVRGCGHAALHVGAGALEGRDELPLRAAELLLPRREHRPHQACTELRGG